MALDVLVGHFKGLERQVGQHHLGLGEHVSGDDADATRPRAQVQNARRLAGQPRLKTFFDQLANGRTRHQHAFVDNERHAAEPGLAQQVGGRYTLFDTALEQVLKAYSLVVLEHAVQVAVGHLPWQVHRTQHQQAGFVPGVVGTVTEEQVMLVEAADRPADVVAQRAQTGCDHGVLLFSDRTKV
ncbi:hypothetical protein D9M71_446770 [compost metagenome]